jgi:hypothetical protein
MQIREIVGAIQHIEVIAKGSSVKIRSKLEKLHGRGNWRKMWKTGRVEDRLPFL